MTRGKSPSAAEITTILDYLDNQTPENRERYLTEQYRATLREVSDLLGPSGLIMIRVVESQIHESKKRGLCKETDDGIQFICDENQVLKSLYPQGYHRRPERVQEWRKYLARMTSPGLEIDWAQAIEINGKPHKIVAHGPLFVLEDTRDVETDDGEILARATILKIPKRSLPLFTMGEKDWHAWGNKKLLAKELVRRNPEGVLAVDWLEHQFTIGLRSHKKKRRFTLDSILNGTGRKHHYLYTTGEISSKPRTGFKLNAMVKQFLKELDNLAKINEKDKFWKSVLIKPNLKAGDSLFKTIPDFLGWLNTTEGKKALRNNKKKGGILIPGPFQFAIQVELGPAHMLNTMKQKRLSAGTKKAGRQG
jgi:hypothetical protein